VSAADSANAFLRSHKRRETLRVPLDRRADAGAADAAAREAEDRQPVERDTTSTNMLLRRATGRPAYVDEQGRAWA
jgi:hypothetical protein